MNQLQKWTARAAAVATGLSPLAVLAQGFGGVSGISGVQQGNNLVGSILTIVNWFLVLAGLVAAIFLILGGVQYIISRGDEGAIDKAKNTILYAVIGLVVIGLSAVIVNFVVTGLGS